VIFLSPHCGGRDAVRDNEANDSMRVGRSDAIVRRLRGLLSDLPEWEIAIAVDIPGQEGAWPVMGLTLRQHEIIDGLQRQYFPPAFQAWAYKDARPGTGFD